MDPTVNDPSDLDAMSSLEMWHLLAALIPIVIGHAGNAFGWTSATAKARLSVAVYLTYAVIGEALKGSFDALTWETPQLVLASLVKVAAISYASYKVIGNAQPKLTGGRPGPSG